MKKILLILSFALITAIWINVSFICNNDLNRIYISSQEDFQTILPEFTLEPETENPVIRETIKPIPETTAEPEITEIPVIKETAAPELTDKPIIEETTNPEITKIPIIEETTVPKLTDTPIVQETAEPEIVETAKPTEQPDVETTEIPKETSYPSSGQKPSGGGSVSSQDDITVYMTVEKLTLGQGFIIEPTEVEVKYGTTCAELLQKVLGDKNYRYSGTEEDGIYIYSVADDETSVNIPEFIMDKLKTISNRKDNEWLSEFDYSFSSGWLYSINNKYPNVGMSFYKLNDGDTVRVQFSLYGYGADVKGNIIPLSEKTKLIRLTAQLKNEYGNAKVKSTAEYITALDVLSNIECTQSEVNSAYKQLASADFSKKENGSSAPIKSTVVFNEIKNDDNDDIKITANISTLSNSFTAELDKRTLLKLKSADKLVIRAGSSVITIPTDIFKNTTTDSAEINFSLTKEKSGLCVSLNYTHNGEAINAEERAMAEIVFDGAEDAVVELGSNVNYKGNVVIFDMPLNKECKIKRSHIGKINDVEPTAVYADALDELLDRGIIMGTGSGMFEPDREFTIGMLAAMLYRESGYCSEGFAWYVNPMEWAICNGYICEGDSFIAVDGELMNRVMTLYMSKCKKSTAYSAEYGKMTRAEGIVQYTKYFENMS